MWVTKYYLGLTYKKTPPVNTPSSASPVSSYGGQVNYRACDSITLWYLNVRSLQKNVDSLSSLIKCFSNLPHIIALSETWLKDSTSHLYVLEGYDAYHSCRVHREHGEVTVSINFDLQTVPIQHYTFVNDDIEICTVLLKLSTNFIFSVICRPHSKLIVVEEFTHTLYNILSQDLFKKITVLYYT